MLKQRDELSLWFFEYARSVLDEAWAECAKRDQSAVQPYVG